MGTSHHEHDGCEDIQDGLDDLMKTPGDRKSPKIRPEALEQPPSAIDSPVQCLEWTQNYDQATESGREFDFRADVEVPLAEAIPSLNRSEETLSFTTSSANDTAEAAIVSHVGRASQNHLVSGTLGGTPSEDMSDEGERYQDDAFLDSSMNYYPPVLPAETPITPPDSDASSDDTNYTESDFIPPTVPGRAQQEISIRSFSMCSISDYEESDDGDHVDEDSPPNDGSPQGDAAPTKQYRTRDLGSESVNDSQVAPAHELGKRRRQREMGNEDGDSEPDDSTTDRPKRPKVDHAQHRLACPFYKFDPVRHRQCHARVLKRNSHVKQHLMRAHIQPLYCNICMEVQPDEDALVDHLRAQQCQKRAPLPPDGITPKQRKMLARKSKSKSETQQWFDVYDIVFPGAPKPKSPYLDNELSEDMESFRAFCGHQGPAIISQEIDRCQGSVSAPPPADVESLKECLQNGFNTLFEEWQSQRRGTQTVPTLCDARTSHKDDTTAVTLDRNLVNRRQEEKAADAFHTPPTTIANDSPMAMQ